MMRKIPIIFILSLCPIFTIKAQKVELGLGGSATFYKGDLQPRLNIFYPAAAGNIFFRYNFNKTLSAKTQIAIGAVKGSDSKSMNSFLEERAFSFKHDILDYFVQLEYNFLNFRTHTGRYEHDWTPYLFGGFGASSTLNQKYFIHNGTTLISQENPTFSGIIPFGIGVKKIITPRFNIGAEFSTRVFTNSLKGAGFDGINGLNNSNVYTTPTSDQFINLPNTKLKDKYFHLTVTLSYLIYNVECDTPGKRFSFF